MIRTSKVVHDPLQGFLPLPLDDAHWQAVVQAMRISPQQAKVVELVLRGLCDKQIATALSLSEPTVRTYMDRISARTRTRGRMELAMRVLQVSHQVRGVLANEDTGPTSRK
jgi:DNA-binding NarL/FixJ family response regulator